MKRYLPEPEHRQKWILMSTLVVALGFSLSAPMKSQMGSSEFASETVEAKRITIGTKYGRFDVNVYQDGEKTMARVPEAATGGTCTSCLSTKLLDIGFEKDADDIEKALYAALAGDPSEETTTTDDSEDDAEEKVKTEKAAADQKKLDRLLSRCKQDKAIDKASCLIKEFTTLIKKDAKDEKKQIDPDEAYSFYSDEIRPLIIEAFNSHESDESLSSFDSIMSASSLTTSNRPDPYAFEKTADLLRKLHANLPRAYSQIREDAIQAAADGVREYKRQNEAVERQAQQMKSQAATYAAIANNANNGLSEATRLQYQQQALMLTQQAGNLSLTASSDQNFLTSQLLPQLRTYQAAGLAEGVQKDYLNVSDLTRLMGQYDQVILPMLSNSVSPLNGTTTVLNTSPIQLPAGITVNPNIQQRGTITGQATTGFAPATTAVPLNRQFNTNLNGAPIRFQ